MPTIAYTTLGITYIIPTLRKKRKKDSDKKGNISRIRERFCKKTVRIKNIKKLFFFMTDTGAKKLHCSILNYQIVFNNMIAILAIWRDALNLSLINKTIRIMAKAQ